MNLCHHLGLLEVSLIIIHEQSPRLVVERRLGKGVDQEAAHNLEHMPNSEFLTPILFEGIDADISRFGDVWVEYFRQKET